MKRPVWATVIGILCIVFSLGGMFYSVELVAMPQMIQMQREMMKGMFKNMKTQDKNAPDFKPVQDIFDKMLGHQPPWFNTAMVVLGLIGILINGLYLFAAISLLMLKKYALRLFYTAIALVIAFAAVRSVVMIQGFSFMSIPMLAMGLVGVIIDGVILIVVLNSDKMAFRPLPPLPK